MDINDNERKIEGKADGAVIVRISYMIQIIENI